jgi:hypothetical protein
MTSVVVLLLVQVCANAQTVESKTLGPDKVILDGGQPMIVQDLTIKDGTVIYTNGAQLTIMVLNDLKIEGKATIESYTPDARKAGNPPSKPPKANDGQSYDPGPGTSGRAPSAGGRSGGEGAEGRPGLAGETGKSAGALTIVVNKNATGQLRIVNTGINGQAGGQGGNAGNGARASKVVELGLARLTSVVPPVQALVATVGKVVAAVQAERVEAGVTAARSRSACWATPARLL